jgi:hypothetical protein
MSDTWYVSARFNAGLNVAKIASDALMAMSIIAINASRTTDKRIEEDDKRESVEMAKNLMMKITEQIEKIPSDRTRIHFHGDSFRDLVDVLLDRAAGNKDRLTEQMKKAILELDRIESCVCVPSEATFSVLSEVVEAAQEVVDSSKALTTLSG